MMGRLPWPEPVSKNKLDSNSISRKSAFCTYRWQWCVSRWVDARPGISIRKANKNWNTRCTAHYLATVVAIRKKITNLLFSIHLLGLWGTAC